MSTCEHLRVACFERKPAKKKTEKVRKQSGCIRRWKLPASLISQDTQRPLCLSAFICLCIQARSRQYVADPSPRSATSCLGDLGGKCDATIWHSLQISLPPKSNRRELVRRLQAFATSTIDATFQPALGNTWTGWHRETSRDVLLRCKAGWFLKSLFFMMYSVLWNAINGT